MTTDDPALSNSMPDPLQDLIADFLDAEYRGQPLDREAWLARHASVADSLKDFLANHDRMKNAVPSALEDVTLPPNSHTHNDATLPPDKGATWESRSSAVGDRLRYFGDYELVEEIARGGMGVVYKALQINLNRIVALKMILAGQLASEQDVQRFRTEAESAANLDHPRIVPIYEVGQHAGQHYFSMGFVDGKSLAQKIVDGPMVPRDAAEMMVKICEGIAFAHERGVIHRDLKPANILLDQNGQPKVTDFGLAKKLGSDSNLTGTGQILGTPSYMAPEQASGKIDEVGPLADIYSLGAILYCLLTGRPPFQAANPMDTLLQVLDKEPIPPRQLNTTIPVDLETICLKCLNKEPHRRYTEAKELSQELGRFLRGEPILARPVDGLERSWRWCKRNPTVAGLIATAAVLLILGSTVSTYFAFVADSKRRAAELAQRSESYQKQLAESSEARARESAELAQLTAAAEKVANAQLRTLNSKLLLEKSVTAMETGNVAEGLFELVHALDNSKDPIQSVVRQNLALWKSSLYQKLSQFDHHGSISALAASKTGDLVATATGSGDGKPAVCSVWNVGKGARLIESQPLAGPCERIRFLDDQRILLTYRDGTFQEWRFSDGDTMGDLLGKYKVRNPTADFPAPLPDIVPNCVSFFVSSQNQLVIGNTVGQLRRWNLDGSAIGEPMTPLKNEKGNPLPVNHITLSPDGSTFLVASQYRFARLFNAQTFEPIGPPLQTKGFITCIAFHPDSRSAFVGVGGGEGFSRSGLVHFIDCKSGGDLIEPLMQTAIVTCMTPSKDGRLVAIGRADHIVNVFEIASKQVVSTNTRHTALVRFLVFNGDSELVSVDVDGSVMVCDAMTSVPLGGTLNHRSTVNCVEIIDETKTLFTGSGDGSVRLWKLTNQESIKNWRPEGTVLLVDEEPLTSKITITSTRGKGAGAIVQSWNTYSGQSAGDSAPLIQDGIDYYAAAPNGRLVLGWVPFLNDYQSSLKVTLSDFASGSSKVIELPSPSKPPEFEPPFGIPFPNFDSPQVKKQLAEMFKFRMLGAARFSPDSLHLVILAWPTGGPHGSIWIYDVNESRFLDEPFYFLNPSNPRALDAGIQLPLMRFTADGKLLVVLDLAGCIVRELQTGKQVMFLPTQENFFEDAAFSPDGKHLATSRGRGIVEIRVISSSLEGEEQIESPLAIPHKAKVSALSFSPDGKFLATACDDFMVRLWDAKTGDAIGQAMNQNQRIVRICFIPSGTKLAVNGFTDIGVWDVSTQYRIGQRIKISSPIVDMNFSKDGSSLVTTDRNNIVKTWHFGEEPTGSSEWEREQIESYSGLIRDEDRLIRPK
jgi:serine/threonine protein kinase/WD40 repeat protein